ncbi:MAG: hypothetical protein IT546_11445 [Caulobacteraceae bacterium]|nr:hypothetical protein [Caulobacteraceae bacterium]
MTDPKAAFQSARQQAVNLRSAVLSQFAEIEYAAGLAIQASQAHGEYTALKPAFPPMVAGKLERLRQFTLIGPWAKTAGTLPDLLTRLEPFKTARTYLAHGRATAAVTDKGEPLLVFDLLRATKGQATPERHVLAVEEAKALSAEIADLAPAILDAIAHMTGNRPKVVHVAA